MMTQCIAIIPARGGSKGIPGKNLINIAGKPLVAWSIEHALKSTLIDAVWVTSDSQEILDVASNYGANTILRPDDISDDLSTSESAWIHALDEIEKKHTVNLVVGMQATSPIRGDNDLDRAIRKFYDNKLDSLLSVTEVEDYFEWRLGVTGAESTNYDFKDRKRRQDIEAKYLENGSFYLFPPRLIREKNNRLGGKIGIFEQERYKMYQIDNVGDVALCEAILVGYGLKS